MIRALAIALLASIGMLVFGWKPMLEMGESIGRHIAVWKVLAIALLVGVLTFLAII